MIGAGGTAPGSGFRVQLAQQPRGIAGADHGVEHLVDRGEGRPVPFVVDLEAADVKAARTPRELRFNIAPRVGKPVEPDALAFHVHRPGPWLEAAVALAAGFGQGDGAQDAQRYAGFRGGTSRGILAQQRVVRTSGRCRRRFGAGHREQDEKAGWKDRSDHVDRISCWRPKRAIVRRYWPSL